MVEPSDPDKSEPPSPILVARERGFRLTQASAKAFDVQDFENAYSLAGGGVDDLLSLIAFLRRNRPQDVPEEIAMHLSEQGITDPENQKDAIQKAREILLFPPLNIASQIRYCCALERRDPDGALEAVAVLVPVARLLYDANATDTGTVLNLVLALMDNAGAFVLPNDDEKLNQAAHCLDEATRLLDTLGNLRCENDDWIRYHSRQIEGSLNAIDRALAAARQNNSPVLEAGLNTLRSQFLIIAGRFKDKL